MSPGEIERELARLRMDEDGTLGARASVLNLVVVTNEETAPGVTRVVSELSGRYPSRVVLIVSDPDEEEANLEVGLSAFCGLRRGLPGGNQVCAEQVKIHVEGPPARHLESLAGPLLIHDLPVFLWYPNGEVPRSPECDGMAALADRLILDSGAADDCGASLRSIASLLKGRRLGISSGPPSIPGARSSRTSSLPRNGLGSSPGFGARRSGTAAPASARPCSSRAGSPTLWAGVRCRRPTRKRTARSSSPAPPAT
jgi:hypothetical protein